MGSSVFSIGITALNAANVGLTTTGHNTANANTAGYTRQVVQQSAMYPLGTGSGFFGMGVQVDSITRTYDQFLTRQVMTAQSQSSYYDTYLAYAEEIDNIVADPDAGVSPAIQSYFSSLQSVATNPSNIPARESYLSSTQSLINRFQIFEQRLSEVRDGINGEITNTVSSINALAEQISNINGQIIQLSASGHSPNDLLDQRDQMLKDLNTYVKASTVTQTDGSVNVFIGSGQALVTGGQTLKLSAEPSPGDPTRITVAYAQGSGKVYLPESLLGGGKLGALLEFRTESLDTAQNSLALVAMGMAEATNKQMAVGIDLDGQTGNKLFSYQTAANGAPAIGMIGAFATNTSAAGLSGYISDVTQLTGSDYELAYDGTNYSLTRQADGSKKILNATEAAALTSATGLEVDGLNLKIDSTPNANDRFTIKPYSGFVNTLSVAMTDARDVAAASKALVLSAGSANTGKTTLTQPAIDTSTIVNPALGNKVSIAFTSATSFTVTDQVTGTTTTHAFTDGMTLSVNGWNLEMTGAPASGDTFTIGADQTGSEDNRNAQLLAALQTTRTLSDGKATYQESYAQMVAKIGTQTGEAQIMATAQATVLSEAQTARDSASAVNLDEEAANLLRYQQAYQAASKVIQVAQQAFQTILDIM